MMKRERWREKGRESDDSLEERIQWIFQYK